MVNFSQFEDSVVSLIHPLSFLVWESSVCIIIPKEVSKISEMVNFSTFDASVVSLIHPLGFLVWESLACIAIPKEIPKI